MLCQMALTLERRCIYNFYSIICFSMQRGSDNQGWTVMGVAA